MKEVFISVFSCAVLALIHWLFASNEESIDELDKINDPVKYMLEIRSRDKWNKLNKAFFEELLRKSGNSIEKLKRFKEISEMLNCVEINYIKICNSTDDIKTIMDEVSLTLYNIGSLNLKRAVEATDKEHIKQYIAVSDMALLSSIMCNEFNIPSYFVLITMYVNFGSKALAKQVYDNMVTSYFSLMNSNENDLSDFNAGMKGEAPLIRHEIESVMKSAFPNHL